jgi:hypothetical protein
LIDFDAIALTYEECPIQIAAFPCYTQNQTAVSVNRKDRLMRQVSNFITGLLLGALVGAALGLLFAPSSGQELREDFQSRADKVSTDVQSAIARERKRLEAELEALKRGEIRVA